MNHINSRIQQFKNEKTASKTNYLFHYFYEAFTFIKDKIYKI